jgi:hypothetical protein
LVRGAAKRVEHVRVRPQCDPVSLGVVENDETANEGADVV